MSFQFDNSSVNTHIKVFGFRKSKWSINAKFKFFMDKFNENKLFEVDLLASLK